MGMPLARRVFACLLVVAASAIACAVAHPPAPANEPTSAAGDQQRAGYPQQSPPPGQSAYSLPNFAEPPASDVPGNIAQIDRAEQALTLLFGPDRVDSGGGDVQPGQIPPMPAPTATGGTPPMASASPMAQADPCSIACAALASMKRSAEHVCGLIGDKDAVCGGARARVQRAEQRVTAACPSCAR